PPLDDAELKALLAAPWREATSGSQRRVIARWIARALIGRGRHAEARAVLSGIQGARAHYLRGVSSLGEGGSSASRPASAPAVRELERARRLDRGNLGDLATLALARLAAAEVGAGSRAGAAVGAAAYQRASALYLSIPPSSPSFFFARQELAWVALAARRPTVALVQTLALRAVRWRRRLRADGRVVESAALLLLCRRAAAARSLSAARRTVRRLLGEVTDFLRSRRERRLYYIHATASIANKSRELGPDLSRALLADAGFRRAVLVVGVLQRERARLVRVARAGSSLRTQLAPQLDRLLASRQDWAGRVVVRVLERLRAQLRRLRVRIGEIAFGLAQRGGPASRPVGAGGGVREQRAEHRAARAGERALRWPIARAPWPDEIGRVVLPLSSRCSSPASR
ncbi:MAG: hypothetical protein KC503_37415, partial [Myxococcales bacterium]|nr:hypothetical protein [Myxococcales bacterium]